jgi:glycosyltransferase involved in cell wall biosynthesis
MSGQPQGGATPELTVVVPVVERCDDLRQIHDEFAAELRRIGVSFEFIFVVDGGQNHVVPVLKELKSHVAEPLSIVLLSRSFGESAALTIGLARARGAWILTQASYFQVPPSGVEPALARIRSGEADLVVGRRFPRSDSWLNRVQSWLFHRLVRALTGSRLRDISCGFRVMKRRVAEELNLYGDLHRFLPILARARGFRVSELPLPQRAEDLKTRFAGPGIYLRRVLDALTVFFLSKFTRKPLRFFGIVGSALFALGFAIGLYLVYFKFVQDGSIADRPLLLLAVLLMVLGVQSVSIGLLGEIIIFTHVRETREYEIAEVLG